MLYLQTYEALRPKYCTGDILICSGVGVISSVIQLVSGGEGSHVATLIRDAMDVVYVLESTTLNKFSRKKGVQLNLFSEWIRYYRGKVWWRSLDMGDTLEQRQQLRRFVAKYRNRPYERSFLELAASVIDFGGWLSWLAKNKEDDSSIFCSELVAMLYRAWHILPAELISNEVIPVDFRKGRSIEAALIKASLGKEIRIR